MKLSSLASVATSLLLTSFINFPAVAGGCKFHGTTALSCEDGKGGYVNTFFNGEKWTEPVSSQSANQNVAPIRIIRVVEPIYIDNRDYTCNRGYCRAAYYPRYR